MPYETNKRIAMNLFEAMALFALMVPLAAMPSSSVALVVARTIGVGRRSGAFSAFGIATGDLIFIALALLGVSILAEWLGALFAFLKYCGGAYLIWLGFKMLRSEPALELSDEGGGKSTVVADFLAGLFLTLGDIKAILFYASLFPVLIDMHEVGLWDALVIAAVTVFAVGGVKLAYVVFASRLVNYLRLRVSSGMPEKVGGTIMIGCGSVLIAKA